MDELDLGVSFGGTDLEIALDIKDAKSMVVVCAWKAGQM